MRKARTEVSWKIFADAKQFFELVSLLTRHDSFVKRFPLGYITNAAFTLELLLKCIISVEGKEIPKLHTLDSLFSMLDEEDKQLILKHHRTVAKELRKNSNDADQIFQQILSRASKDFVKARYFFDDLKSPDENGWTYFDDIPPLLQATYNAILELRPEWKSAANVTVKNERKI